MMLQQTDRQQSGTEWKRRKKMLVEVDRDIGAEGRRKEGRNAVWEKGRGREGGRVRRPFLWSVTIILTKAVSPSASVTGQHTGFVILSPDCHETESSHS